MPSFDTSAPDVPPAVEVDSPDTSKQGVAYIEIADLPGADLDCTKTTPGPDIDAAVLYSDPSKITIKGTLESCAWLEKGNACADNTMDDPSDAEGEETEVRPDLIFLDPPYKAVTEDPTRSAYRCQQLLARMAPGGVICFHFLDGNLDRDDFDASLNVEIRRWGKSAVALLEVPASGEAGDAKAEESLATDTAYDADEDDSNPAPDIASDASYEAGEAT